MNKRLFLDNSIQSISSKIKNKLIKIEDILEIVFDLYDNNESLIRAWTYFDKNKIEYKNNFGPLFGIPFGIKDIFNTEKMPTEMGSPIWKGYKPNNNARAVDSLINKGCIPIGKTVTAEFAVHHLNETLNPHDYSRTPGTSSSGSAAAVAVGMVPFSLGSQTAGSIIRPASFCGVWGMKPSFGLIPRTGVLKTTDSLDTIGFLTSQGENLRTILDCLRVKGPNYPYVYKNIDKKIINKEKKIRVGVLKTHTWDNSKQYAKDQLMTLARSIEKLDDYELEEVDWPDEFNNTHKIHSTIYNKSLAYYFKNEIKLKNDISDSLKYIIDLSQKITIKEFHKALLDQEIFSEKLDILFKPYDFLITLSTGSSAPLREEKEIDDSSLIWTLGHVPAVSIPIFKCPKKLPIGIQFISRKWND